MTCTCCNGGKLLEMKVQDLGTLEWRWAVVGCHVCDSKGYISQDDRERVHNVLNQYRK
jgi:hypothetical protein